MASLSFALQMWLSYCVVLFVLFDAINELKNVQ